MMKFLLFLLLLTSLLLSAPALHKQRVYVQEDGSTFKATSKGDELLHWIEDENGNILTFNKKTKNYDFSKIEDKQLKPSGEIYNAQRTETRALKKHVYKDELKELWRDLRQQRAAKHLKHNN